MDTDAKNKDFLLFFIFKIMLYYFISVTFLGGGDL